MQTDGIRKIDRAAIEAVRRLDAVRAEIGRVEGPSIVEDLRRDRRRDMPEETEE